MKKLLKIPKRLSITLFVLLVIAVVFGLYISISYDADVETIFNMEAGENHYIDVQDDGALLFIPNVKTEIGLIFYQGGKVDEYSYLPLLSACAERGIMCVLVKMPFNLAVFDINAADGIVENHPEIENWYIAGHSLGGSMAASYLEKNFEDYDGLILLGSYSTANISDTPLKVLSIYGSEDKVMNKEKYDECMANLPKDTVEYIIEGGCHAYFGVYGAQKGDGTPTITNIEQIIITAEKIKEFVN